MMLNGFRKYCGISPGKQDRDGAAPTLRCTARMLLNRKLVVGPIHGLGLSPTAIAVHKRHASLVDPIKDALLRARSELRPTTHRRFAFARVQLYGGDSILRRLRGLPENHCLPLGSSGRMDSLTPSSAKTQRASQGPQLTESC
jgi:hypothetical protein